MQTDFPRRKPNRLNGYDYSRGGAYFITVCTKDRKEILWSTDVGDGVLDVPLECAYDIGNVHLSGYGEIIKKHINNMNKTYSDVQIIQYVIMPNHIHFIIQIKTDVLRQDGTSRTPSPTNAVIPQTISTLKRFVNKELGFNIFQRSYHDRIIRNEKEYHVISEYIKNNPSHWEQDSLNRRNHIPMR